MLVEEALRARVLEEMSAGQYRFTHALMQETLLGELSAARQVLLHGQIAEAFETLYGPDDRNHLAALAGHYAESAVLNRDHARAAVRYLRLAAEQSAAALGYEDAIALYERCLAIIEQAHDPLGEDEAALWDALAMGYKYIGNVSQGTVALDRALALYGERGDAHARARAFIGFMQGNPDETRVQWALFEQLIAALGDADSVELCHSLAWRARVELGAEGDAIAARAEAMAARLDLAGEAYPTYLKMRQSLIRVENGQFREAAAVFDAIVVAPNVSWSVGRANMRSWVRVWAGDIDAAAVICVESIADARRYRRRFSEANGVGELAQIAWRRGDRPHYEQLVLAYLSPGIV